MKIFSKLALALALALANISTGSATTANANDNAKVGEAPELEFAFEIKCKCDAAYSVGKTSKGERIVIPIVGGTFEGPGIKGTVLPGGADYQLQDKERGRTELEAIYCIRTDDGATIHVRNVGLIVASDGQFYFRTVPKFEAPNDSKYNWLNNAIFICTPGFGDGYISLKMWKVK